MRTNKKPLVFTFDENTQTYTAKAVLLKFDVPDVNGRIYSYKNTKSAITDYKKRIKKQTSIGQLWQGEASYPEDFDFNIDVLLNKATHFISDMYVDKEQNALIGIINIWQGKNRSLTPVPSKIPDSIKAIHDLIEAKVDLVTFFRFAGHTELQEVNVGNNLIECDVAFVRKIIAFDLDILEPLFETLTIKNNLEDK